MWFWLSLIALLCWSGSDLFSKIGCQGEDDHLAHLKMVIAVGTVMGLHAAFEIFVGGTEISWSIIWTYLPVSLLYIGSMTLGYLGLRYIELSVSSPICNSSGALVAVMTLLFVGGDEIMLDDTRLLYEKLTAAGCKSRMIVAPERWHAYVLYCLSENMPSDFEAINKFMDRVLSPARSLRWMRLDNAAKIYPAAKRRNWVNFFRLSAELSEPVDIPVLRAALDVTVRRFPSIAVRLQPGVFWYYLEQLPKAPEIQAERSCPLAHAPFGKVRECALRVLVYNERNRVAVEFFHAVTDGNGGMTFFKTLLAEYISQKYGVAVPTEHGVLGRLEEPDEEELEDSFLRYAGDVKASRKEATAYHLTGTPEPDGFKNLITMIAPSDDVRAAAKRHGVTVTELLCAAMMQAINELQAERVPQRRLRKPVKVLLPVNLRRMFPSKTLRNFVSYITPEIDPCMGDYSFDEICSIVHHRMGLENNPQSMRAKFAANVASEKSPFLKVVPLFVKNIVMKAVFDRVGECKSCLCLSNLGNVQLPEVMAQYVSRLDFIIGVQAKAPHNCGVVSWNGTMYINCIRNIREAELEMRFYQVLKSLGIHIKVESNIAIISGVDQYTGARVNAPDLRAGAALVIAGLGAEGITVVDDIYYIERGYEAFDQKLSLLGALIEKVSDEKEIQKFTLKVS